MSDATAGNTQRLPELDGVRGLAIVLVLIGHLFNALMPEAAGFGVSLFFALSGYLITGILIKEHSATGGISLGNFYLRRARRLLPPLIVFLSAFAVWAWSAGWSLAGIAHSTLPVLFYSANWSGVVGWGVGHYMDHTWSLSVEEQFYIGWPIVLLALVRLRSPWLWTLVLAGLVVLLRYAAVYLLGVKADSIYTLLRYDEILLGCALAFSRVRFPAWVGCIALASAFVLATIPGMRLAGNYLGYVLIAIIMATIVGSAAQLRWFFGNIVLRHFGRISYSVYLWHFTIWVITADPWITLASSIALAELSWYLLEQSILSGRRLRRLTPADTRSKPAAIP